MHAKHRARDFARGKKWNNKLWILPSKCLFVGWSSKNHHNSGQNWVCSKRGTLPFSEGQGREKGKRPQRLAAIHSLLSVSSPGLTTDCRPTAGTMSVQFIINLGAGWSVATSSTVNVLFSF